MKRAGLAKEAPAFFAHIADYVQLFFPGSGCSLFYFTIRVCPRLFTRQSTRLEGSRASGPQVSRHMFSNSSQASYHSQSLHAFFYSQVISQKAINRQDRTLE